MTIAVDWDVKHQTKPKKCHVSYIGRTRVKMQWRIREGFPGVCLNPTPRPLFLNIQAFKWALLFLFFLLFPTFLICSYFSLLFHENALLSLLFHSKMSFTHKNPEILPRSLRSLRFYKSTSMFIQKARCLLP